MIATIQTWHHWILLSISLYAARKRKVETDAILSDILETGQSTATLYRRVAQLVQSKGINKLIGVGQEISSCSARFNDDLERYFFPNTEALLASNILKIASFGSDFGERFPRVQL